MVAGNPASHPVPVTGIFVPGGPAVGEIVIEGAAGGALVGGSDDGVTDTVADGVALRVGGRVDRDARGVGDTENSGVATAPGEGPLVIGSPTGCDVVMTAIPTPSTSATT